MNSNEILYLILVQGYNQTPVLQQPTYPHPPIVQGAVPTAPLLQGQYPPQPGVVIVGASFGRDPTTMQCPHCKQQIRTSTKSKIGVMGKIYQIS